MMPRLSFAGIALVAFGLAGCSDDTDPERPTSVSAELSETISTVVKVRWTTTEKTTGYVQYGPTADMAMNTPVEETAGTDHELTLLGLTADTDVHYRVVTWDGGDAGASEPQLIHTGDLPLKMPTTDVTGGGNDRYTIVPILGNSQTVSIINPEGQFVWYYRDERALDFYRARLALDGKSVLYNAASVSGDPADNSELVRVALDGSTSTSIKVPLLAHDFVELDDGTLAAMVVEYRGEYEGKPLRGDSIVEISPDGTQKKIWDSWMCFDPATQPSDDMAHGWTFANALDYDATDDTYLLSMRNFSSITKINRTTAECEWVLGFTASTMKFAPGSARFEHEHQFQLRGDKLLVFDNDGSLGDESRVLEYKLDFANNLATQTWSYVSNPTVYSFVLGEPIRLDGDDGDVFIDWATAGQLERVSNSGESLWKLNTNAGFAFGFITLAKSLYPASANSP